MAGRVTLRFKRERYLQLVAERRWTTQGEQACGLGLSQGTVGKILSGKQTPGPDAIAALLNTFQTEQFADLFEIVSAEKLRVAS